MVEDLPIDIHSSKLLDWLVSRRHCNKDWQKNVLTIREKIKHAILDMPESQKIVNLLQGAYINYFHCIQIIEILRDTEKDTKNFMGFYSSQRMKDWQEIEGLYRKENVYLAEAAQTLQRLAQYEIPALKKQISKNGQAVTDAVKKFNDYGRLAEDSKKQFGKEIERMNIRGNNLRAELLELVADLPVFFEKIAEDCKSLLPARNYFESFRNYMNESPLSSSLLPTLHLFCDRGVNVTAYEWKYHQKPDRVQKPSLDLLLKADEQDTDNEEIDFGDGDDYIGDVDFGNDIQIDVVADNTGAVGEKVAHGLDALNILENSDAQKAFKLELGELLAFLTMRLEDETRVAGADILIRGSEKRPEGVAEVTEQDLKGWIQNAENILAELNNSQKVHLMKIRGCPQYVEQVVQEVSQKRDMETRYKRLQSLMTEKQEAAQDAVLRATEELKTIVDSARVLQKQLENEISKKYSGRRVNLMGGINQALAGI
uniref:CDK5RAP3-like protein n=1 Tax=Caenorhabditis japonica TaxID=281687 RepID=A0A8R1DJH7_CAEJA